MSYEHGTQSVGPGGHLYGRCGMCGRTVVVVRQTTVCPVCGVPPRQPQGPPLTA